MRSWLKGGIIGAAVYLFDLLLGLLAYNCSIGLIVEGKNVLCGSNNAIFVWPHFLLLSLLPFKTAVSIMLQPAALQVFMYLVLSVLIGALVGWLIGNIKILSSATIPRKN